jgi:GT2 family glycosyltransferase
LIFKDNGPKIWFGGGKIDWLRMKTIHTGYKKTDSRYIKSPFISGCAMLIKKEVFREIGLFDQNYFLYWEDADFCWRSKEAGFDSVLVPKSMVYHFEKSQGNLEQKTYWLVFSGLLFFRKNAPKMLKLWLSAYIAGRKLKNIIDVRRQRNVLAPTVAKAYHDFKNAQF